MIQPPQLHCGGCEFLAPPLLALTNISPGSRDDVSWMLSGVSLVSCCVRKMSGETHGCKWPKRQTGHERETSA